MNTIIEKIRAEVERRIKSWQTRGEHYPEGQGKDTCVSRVTELTDLLNFIETCKEQPVCEGLEEEISRYLREDCSDDDEPSISEVARHFAKWQKEQMMKEAVEGEIQMRYSGCLCAKTIRAINEDKFKLGDKVKIIIVKED